MKRSPQAPAAAWVDTPSRTQYLPEPPAQTAIQASFTGRRQLQNAA
jgi:hypothetical protein